MISYKLPGNIGKKLVLTGLAFALATTLNVSQVNAQNLDGKVTAGTNSTQETLDKRFAQFPDSFDSSKPNNAYGIKNDEYRVSPRVGKSTSKEPVVNGILKGINF